MLNGARPFYCLQQEQGYDDPEIDDGARNAWGEHLPVGIQNQLTKMIGASRSVKEKLDIKLESTFSKKN